MPAKLDIFARVSFQEKLLFTKHLDTMIKAGVPIAEALSTLSDQAKSKQFKKVLSSILTDVENGQSLASSLKKHKSVFDDFYTSLVEIGEESGTMEENLSFLSKQLAKDFALRKKIQSAMIYPAIVLLATGIMGSFIGFFVLPKLVDFFESFEIDLPLPTRILLFIARAFKDYGLFIAFLVIFSIILFRFLLTLPKVKSVWHVLIIRLPMIGKLIAFGQLARFSRNFGTLIKSGVPVSKSLTITSNTLSNLKFKKDLEMVTESLNKGKNIGESLSKKEYFEYPPLVSKMIAIGEKTGKLDETLLYLSDFYEEEVDNLSKNLSTIVEPILLIGIGLIVGFVALSIISPIYELTGSIRR